MGKLMPNVPQQRPSKRTINRSQSTYASSFQSLYLPNPKPKASTSSAIKISKTTLTQVSFLCQDGIKVKANKPVLASRNEYFRSLLISGFRESLLQEISLPCVTSTVFRVVLEHLMTGRFLKDIITPANVLEVYEAADFFMLPELRKDVIKLAERTFAPTRTKLVALLTSVTAEFDSEEQYPDDLLRPLINKLFFLLKPWQAGSFSGLSPAALKLVLEKLPKQWMVNENLLASHLLLWALERSVHEVAEEGVLRSQETKFCSEKVVDYCFEIGFFKSQLKPGSLPMDIMEVLPASVQQLKSVITSAPAPRIPLTRKMWAPISKRARTAISAVAEFVTWERVHPNLLLFLKHTGIFSVDQLQKAHNNIQVHLQHQLQLQQQTPRSQAPTPTLTRQTHRLDGLSRLNQLNQFNRARAASNSARGGGPVAGGTTSAGAGWPMTASTASTRRVNRTTSARGGAPMTGTNISTRTGALAMVSNNSITHYMIRHPLRSLIWESVQFSNNYSIVEDCSTLTAPWQEPVVVFTSTPFPAYGQYSWSFLVEKGCKCHSDIWIGLLAGPSLTRAKIKANTLALNARATGYAFGCQSVLHPVSASGYHYGVEYERESIVTVHLDMSRRTCGFSVNGMRYPTAWHNLPDKVYAAVSMRWGARLKYVTFE